MIICFESQRFIPQQRNGLYFHFKMMCIFLKPFFGMGNSVGMGLRKNLKAALIFQERTKIIGKLQNIKNKPTKMAHIKVSIDCKNE